jgi:hypothetical protein
MITSLESTTMGCRQPNSLMDAATLSIADCGILRAFRAYGIGFVIGQFSIVIAGYLHPKTRNQTSWATRATNEEV